MRATVSLLFITACLALSVYAGPGTHQYNQPHSNYGDEKKNKQ
jgi:hypothetical protein